MPNPVWSFSSYDPVGRCIYCGSTHDLSDEHIIPFGLLPKGGDWFLPDASCGACCEITKKFEGSVQQNMLGPIRAKMGLKTRRKPKKMHATTFNYPDGRLEAVDVSLDEFPRLCIGFRWPAPGLIRGIFPTPIFEGETVARYNEEDMKRFVGTSKAAKIARVYVDDFARMLAKIAHTYTVAEFGAESFRPMLPDFILGKAAWLPYLVGGDESSVPLPEFQEALHHIYRQDCRTNGVDYLLIAIRLFAVLGMPRYHVIVGQKV